MRRLAALSPLLLCLGLITAVYAPFVLEGKVQIHGDGVAFSVPMLHLLKQSLARGELPLWTELAYGGHPVFAESQIGALNPLNVAIAWLFDPLTGHTAYHFVALLLSACGMWLFARELGARPAAAGVGAIALVLSPLWLGTQNNLTISAASMCVPWLLWSFERWLRTLRPRDAALFALVGALAVCSGYPQIVHGTGVYVALRGLCALLDATERARLRAAPALTAFGLAAMPVLAGLIAAAQLLPLAELTQLSYRQQGVALFEAPATWYLRGLFYSLYDPADAVFAAGPGDAHAQQFMHFNLSGSIAVCLLAAAAVLFVRARGVLAHLVATAVLLNLGFGSSSPLWQFVHEHGLLPGLDRFRAMSAYFNVALCGIALLAALATERLAAAPTGRRNAWLLGALAAACVPLLVRTYSDWVSAWQFLAPAVLALALLARTRVPRLPLAAIACGALALEVFALRLQPFLFHAPELLREPPSTALYAGDRRGDFRHFDGSVLVLYAQQNALSGRVADGLGHSIEALTPTACALWGIASIHGGMALDLARRRLIEQPMIDEIADPALRAAGTRLIDALSVRYLTAGAIVVPQGMPVAYRSADDAVVIFENPRALPKLRAYTRARAVPDATSALAALADTAPDTLIVECPDAACVQQSAPSAGPPATLRIRERTPTRLVVDVQAVQPGWLFVADANYPGWRARLDGEAVPVRSAQVLGKAVAHGAGSHRVELRFAPRSLQLGLAGSVLGLALTLAAIALDRGRSAAANR